jgi:hypothetical protein
MSRMRLKLFLAAFIACWACALTAWAEGPAGAPQGLAAWKDWVLYGHETELCPSPYNNADLHHCAWPSRLRLDLHPTGGRFVQEWRTQAETWVPLPGGPGRWPGRVTAGGEALAVADRNGVPQVRLPAGEHRLEGAFSWEAVPELIRVPPATGLVDVRIDGEPLAFPKRDAQGRLWLASRERKEGREDRLEVTLHRLVRDTIPMRVATRIELQVAGRAREITLENVLLDPSVPMRIDSPLPARFDAGERLLLQARPGRWEIRLETRLEGPVRRIGPVAGPYGREVWSFEAQNHLRMVEVEGVPAVDPDQADVPTGWRRFPAYRVRPGDTIRFREIRRGDPDPAPDRLRLQRTWWLDFDGAGFTIQDRITGTMNRDWALAMNPPTTLGRVQVDGEDRLIIDQAEGEAVKAGVELRKGHLDLTADSRLTGRSRVLPAVGWEQDFQSVSAVLHLPPGWRLLTASGVDVLPGTWFERWTLLDLFLVLIIAMAVWNLQGRARGLLALVTLVLIFHEPGAPRLVWLHLAASLALLKLLSGGWFRRVIQLWFLGALVTLVVLSVPFMVQQVRVAVYPQLERPGAGGGGLTPGRGAPVPMEGAPQVSSAPVKAEDRVAEKEGAAALGEALTGYAARKSMSRGRTGQASRVQDPDALIQTGPGLPSWTWRTLTMGWNGPVDRGQEIRLRLLSPGVNLVLALLRVAFLALLIAGLTGARKWWPPRAGAAAAVLLLFLFAPPPAGAAEASGMETAPPRWLLQEFERRLLEPDDCFPHCAASPEMRLEIDEDGLVILFEVHAATRTAVPLPGGLEGWSPQRVLVDDRPAEALLRDARGVLWALVPPGVHRISLRGALRGDRAIPVALPLRPQRALARAEGWEVEGIGPNGVVEGSLQLTPARSEESESGPADTVLQPFLHLERVVHLGLTWRVENVLERLTPPGAPVVVSVPLLEGESVLTEGVRVERGRARIHMAPEVGTIRWASALEKTETIRLRAPESVPWTETWILDAGPVWHCETSGIPVIHHQDKQGFWRPEWRPWPGEEVVVAVTRPEPVPGRSVTVDEARLRWIPGKRFDKGVLTLTVRTSKGGRHRIGLPGDSRLQQVRIDGKSLPVRLEEGAVVVPLHPGRRSVEVEWHQASSGDLLTRAPEVNVGGEAVNARVSFQMPRDRWILWTGGPRLGPAVLFWSYLAVVVLAAIGLGRVPWTPLRTRHWLLLGLGLTQVHPLAAVLVVGWLLALGLRGRQPFPVDGRARFDGAQVLLVVWTAAALAAMYFAIQKGLLGIPDMQIAGNGSTALGLHWMQDRIPELMPSAWVLSLPLFTFRILMLAWALWLALSLLGWLRWGWRCFSRDGIWRPLRRKRKAAAAEETFDFQE